jgi:hypothetical protein
MQILSNIYVSCRVQWSTFFVALDGVPPELLDWTIGGEAVLRLRTPLELRKTSQRTGTTEFAFRKNLRTNMACSRQIGGVRRGSQLQWTLDNIPNILCMAIFPSFEVPGLPVSAT